jgi:hypothetical protein
MAAAAPRYPPKLLHAIRRLDDESVPLAETCRRVAAFAEDQGLTRPSIVHLRTYVAAERKRRQGIRRIRDDAVARLAAGLVPDPVEVALDVREVNLRNPRRTRL